MTKGKDMDAKSVQALAEKIATIRRLQSEIRTTQKDFIDSLVTAARDFAGTVSTDRWRWLSSSKYHPIMHTGAISDGKYTVAADTERIHMSVADAYDCWMSFSVTFTQASDFRNFLEKEYQKDSRSAS